MKLKRIAFPALAVALAACATPPQGDAPSPALAGQEPALSAAPAPGPQPALQKQDGPAANAERKEAQDPKAGEPRIIRGNDRVIAPPKPIPAPEGSTNAFKFEDAPISEVVHVMMRDILKVDYVLHQPVAGSVTLATKSRVTADKALAMLEAALQANGLAMARDTRGVYHVGKPEVLKNVGVAVRQAGGKDGLPPGYGAIVVPLQYIGAAEMATILRPMMQGDSLVRVDNLRNLLVLAGTRAQAEGWLELVATFDVDLLKGMSVGVFPLKYASIKEVEAALALVSGGGGSAPGTGATTAPRAGATASTAPANTPGGSSAAASASLGEANPLFGALRIMPIERLNSILVVTPRAAYLDEARRWIERLDQPSDNNAEPQLFIYQVQNVNARHLATVLSGIFGGQAAGPANTTGIAPGLAGATGTSFGQAGSTGAFGGFGGNAIGGFGNNTTGAGLRSTGSGFTNLQGARTGANAQAGVAQTAVAANLGNIRVMADELNNSVLIWGTRNDYAKIEATLKRLDLPLTQVLIEASIIEVTLNDDLRYGLQWAFNDSRSSTDFTGVGTLSNAAGGVLGGALAGFSYALKSPSGSVRAMLNALSAKTTVKVVASPSLMVLDNHTASISVGDQTPIQSGTTTNLEGSVQTTNIQYKDTGVNLVVTPSVNAGNIVTMQVDQSVTDVGAKDEVTNQRAFLQRQLSSKVAVRSGESIVMGGLIQENSTAGKTGIPILHTLPVVGNLFGSTTNDGRRTELLVVITPRVVRSDIDIRQVSEELRDRMKGLVRVEGLEGEDKPSR